MNIYHISWVQGSGFGLNAVVIAESEDAALLVLNLNPSYNDKIKASLIGVCTDGSMKSCVVCHESL